MPETQPSCRNQPPGNEPAAARFRALVFAGFFLTGVVTTILGPTLPLLAARWALNDSQAGFYFTAQFAGSLIGVLAYTFLARDREHRFLLLAGYLLMVVGVSLIGAPAHRISLLGMFLTGIALGLVIITSNLFVASALPAKRAASVSLLNVAWGVGAVSCPFLIRLTTARIGLETFLLSLAAVLGILFLAIAVCPAPRHASAPEHGPSRAEEAESSPRYAGLALLASLFFLYVGLENSFGGWVASFTARIDPLHAQTARLTPSLFWGALLLGRILVPALLRRFTEGRLVLAGLTIILCSSVFLLLAKTTHVAMAAVATAGLGCAAIFPILVAWLTALPGIPHAGLRGVPFACGNFGGASLPWLVGAVSTRFGGLNRGFLVVVVASALLLVLTSVFRRFSRTPIPGAS